MCEAALSRLQEKAGILARNSYTLWLQIERIIFLTCGKTSFAILIGRIIIFTCEKHSSLWLARTHLLIKIYNTTLWWVFLSMYIIKQYYLVGLAIFHAIIEKYIYINAGDVHRWIQDSALQWRSCNSSRRTTQCEYIWSLIQICFVDQLMSGPTLLGYETNLY